MENIVSPNIPNAAIKGYGPHSKPAPSILKRKTSNVSATQLAPMQVNLNPRTSAYLLWSRTRFSMAINSQRKGTSKTAPRGCEISITSMKTIADSRIAHAHA
jgi:hypothetical protein